MTNLHMKMLFRKGSLESSPDKQGGLNYRLPYSLEYEVRHGETVDAATRGRLHPLAAVEA